MYKIVLILPNISTNTHLCFTVFQLTIGEATTSPGMDNTAGSLMFSVEYDILSDLKRATICDERYESWLKINHPYAVSKTSTASSPQISDAHQASMSSTLSPTISHESSSTQSVFQSSPLQTPMSSNGVSSTPTVAGASSSQQDQSAPGSTPLTTTAKMLSFIRFAKSSKYP